MSDDSFAIGRILQEVTEARKDVRRTNKDLEVLSNKLDVYEGRMHEVEVHGTVAHRELRTDFDRHEERAIRKWAELEVRVRKNESFRIRLKVYLVGLSGAGGLIGAGAGHLAELLGK